jgi:phosphate transport system substrate-binding protein
MPLVLDFETIASIYLSEITMWNDPRIKAINSPEVADALPEQAITVITQSISSAITQLLTEMLSAVVPRFAATVRLFTT